MTRHPDLTLSSAFGIGAEDIAANRAGRLTAVQRRSVTRQSWALFWVFASMAVLFFIPLIVRLAGGHVAIGAVVGLGAVGVGWLVLIGRFTLKGVGAARQGVVTCVTDVPHAYRVPRAGVRVSVGDRSRLTAPGKVLSYWSRLLQPGPYHVYILEPDGPIVAMEPAQSLLAEGLQ